MPCLWGNITNTLSNACTKHHKTAHQKHCTENSFKHTKSVDYTSHNQFSNTSMKFNFKHT